MWHLKSFNVRNICYKGEDIVIFNVQINEKCELIINHFFQKKHPKSFKGKCKVKLNFKILFLWSFFFSNLLSFQKNIMIIFYAKSYI